MVNVQCSIMMPFIRFTKLQKRPTGMDFDLKVVPKNKLSKFSIFLTENFRCLFHGTTTPKSRNWTWRWARIGYGLLRRSRKSVGYRDHNTTRKSVGYREFQPYKGRSQAMKLITLTSLLYLSLNLFDLGETHPADIPLVYKFAKSIYSRFFQIYPSKRVII